MKTLILVLIILSTTFLGSSLAQTPNWISENDLNHIKNIENNLTPVFILEGRTYRKTILQMMKEDKVPGVSIAFVDNGRLAWAKGYGYADLETQAKVTPDTVFLSASLSKPVTAMAALHLVEQGILRLDEDVNTKLKGWKVPESHYTKKQKVTLRRLINHSSGLTVNGGIFLGYDTDEKMPTVEQILRGESPSKNSVVSVNFEPGSKRSYSNAGYLVLQQLMTDATGKDFSELIRQIVFVPTNMHQSSFQQPISTSLFRRKAIGYSSSGQAKKFNLYPFMAPAGLWTTPSDLGKFMITILNDYSGRTTKIVSERTLEQVLNKTDERLGFSKIFHGHDVLFRHTGSNDGFYCYMIGSVDKRQALIMMTNSDNGFDLVEAIQRAVVTEYNWEYFKPEVYKEYKVLPARLNQYSGLYEMEGERFEFKVQNNGLYVRSTKMGDDFQRTIPISENEFVVTSKPTKFAFVATNNEAINQLRITDYKADNFVAERVQK